jgi:CheY-like chemotaxis protein
MKSHPIRVLYFEDDPSDAERYARLLSETNKIIVTGELVPKHVDELRLSPTPDLVLIDYRLTQRQPTSGISATYRGGTLATYIAEKLPEKPLVIFSTRDCLNLFPNYEEEIRTVDYILYKEDLNQDLLSQRNFLVTLVQGFKSLTNARPGSRTWSALMQLLHASRSEEEDLQRSSPPHGENDGDWCVHHAARWILMVLFRYPGVLYDSLYASTSLGVREEDFLQDTVQSFFRDAQYSGIFVGMKKLWWRDRLQKLAFECIREAKLEPILSDNFIRAFRKKTGVKLKPSICVSSGEKNANAVCYILKKPVKMKYTLGYLPDNRPESMETARVSFKAVIEENVDKKLLPRADAERLTEIRRNSRC